jgi:hypothetical protein
VTPTVRPRGLCLSGGCGASQSVAFLEEAPIYKCKVAGTPSWPDAPKGTPQGSSPRGPVSTFSRICVKDTFEPQARSLGLR